MSSTLSLEASKKVFKIVGEYEASSCWINGTYEYDPEGCPMITVGDEWALYYGKPTENNIHLSLEAYGKPMNEWNQILKEEFSKLKTIPSPNFAELIRVLSKIGEKKGWDAQLTIQTIQRLAWLYADAPTEEFGMTHGVEKYLLPLL